MDKVSSQKQGSKTFGTYCLQEMGASSQQQKIDPYPPNNLNLNDRNTPFKTGVKQLECLEGSCYYLTLEVQVYGDASKYIGFEENRLYVARAALQMNTTELFRN